VSFVETEPDPSLDVAVPELPDVSGSQLARWGLSAHDVLVLAAGFLFCAGAGPFEFGGWTPRMAALLAGLPLGVVLLVRQAWRRDRAALAATAFLLWAFIGAMASGAPWRSIIGQVDGNTHSVVIFCGVFGFWALARNMSDRGRALVGPVLVGSLGLSAMVGVLQIVLDISGGPLAYVGGRAGGLEGNAVMFATTLCGACAWCASTAISAGAARSRLAALTGVAIFALAIGLSGSRISIIAIIVVSAAVCWRARDLRSLRVPGAAVVGLLASFGLQRVVQLGADSVQRFESAGSSGRPDVWRASLAGFSERPFLGWGLGRVRPAIQSHFTPEFVRLHQQSDAASAWNDVHNIILQMLVSVGIVGVVVLVVFLVVAFRRADFALSLAAVAISINWLLQPAGISSLGVAAIFLGASATRVATSTDETRRRLRALTASAVVLGLMAALALVVADLNLRRAVQSGDHVAIRSAAAWFGDDPFVIDIFLVGTYRPDIAVERTAREAAARRAADAEPDVPTWWNELAMTQWDTGELDGMRASVEKALALQPNHVRSWVQLTMYAKRVGDTDLEKTARTHACDLGAPVCAPTTP
jgi:O-antigen ligase